MKLRHALFSLIAFSALATPIFATAARASEPTPSLFDAAHAFECTRLATQNGKPVIEDGQYKYDKYFGAYPGNDKSPECTLVGPLGEDWHSLFPTHPASGDRTCAIAIAEQKAHRSKSKFPTEPCGETNEVANLLSANSPASAKADVPFSAGERQSNSFAARVEMIKRAKLSIRIQYLIVFGDESGWALAELLKQKKHDIPSIDIRVNVDSLSNLADETHQRLRTQAMYFDLKQHGIDVEGYEPGFATLVNEVNWKTPLIIDKRWHDKIFVIDAEDADHGFAIAGGQNIANEYFRVGYDSATKQPSYPIEENFPLGKKIWRDQDVLVRGPIVRDFAKAFDNNYNHFKLVKKKQAHFDTDKTWQKFQALANRIDADHPTLAQRAEIATFKLAAKFFGVPHDLVPETVPGINHKVFRVKFYPEKTKGFIPATVAHVKSIVDAIQPNQRDGRVIDGSVIDKLRFFPATMRWFNNHPRYRETYIMQAYVDAIKRSRHDIIVSNAYFIPDRESLDANFIDALHDAAKRCVKLTFMSNDRADNDGPIITDAARYFYKDLLSWNTETRAKCGGQNLVEILEWGGVPFAENINHAKYAIFDGGAAKSVNKEVIVGSFNLDPRSVWLNSETVLAVRSEDLATDMYEQFWKNDVPKSRWFTWEDALKYHVLNMDIRKALLGINEL